MKPSAYFRELVEPALADFEANPTSIRHAYAACLFAWHFADAVHMDRGETKSSIKQGIAAHTNPERAYWTVGGIATLAKHLEVTRLPVKPKPDGTHVGPEAAFADGRYIDKERSWTKAEEVVRTWDDQGNAVDIRWCLREACRAIAAYLASRPELEAVMD